MRRRQPPEPPRPLMRPSAKDRMRRCCYLCGTALTDRRDLCDLCQPITHGRTTT